jgi:hypothetical protein
MAKYRVSALTSAGSTTLPIISLYGGTTVRPRLRELHLFNTTTTAVSLKLVRVTTTGTQGAGLTEMQEIAEDTAAIATAFQTHTVAPTITSGDLERVVLGAAIGSGVMLTFGDGGIVIPATANNGLAVVVSTGTGQVVEATLVWEE